MKKDAVLPPSRQRHFKAAAIALAIIAGATALVIFYVPIMTFIGLLAIHLAGAVLKPLEYEAYQDVRMLVEPVSDRSFSWPMQNSEPVLLSFADNPKSGIIVDRTQNKSLQRGAQVVTAHMRMWGYRFHGVKGTRLISIDGETYSGPETRYARTD